MKKYLINGEEVEAIQQLDDGRWLVYHYYYECVQTAPDDFYEDEILSDRPDVVSQVFDTPPIPKIDESVKRQQEILNKLRAEIHDTEERRRNQDREFEQAKRQHNERMQKYVQYGPSLDNLDAVLNGEITHYVVKGRYNDIGHVEEYKKEDFENRYRGPKKFLILGQNDAGELRWYLNEYDELSEAYSHDNKYIWPCTSEAQARAIVQRQINEAKNINRGLLDYAEKYGYIVKKEWKERVQAEEQAMRLSELKKARDEFEKAKKRMDELSQDTN